MKYAVILPNKANNDCYVAYITTQDYCFVVDGHSVESAYFDWKQPKDYKKHWLLVAVIPIQDVGQYAAKHDGVPLQIKLQCCFKKDLTSEESYMLGLEYEAN